MASELVKGFVMAAIVSAAATRSLAVHGPRRATVTSVAIVSQRREKSLVSFGRDRFRVFEGLPVKVSVVAVSYTHLTLPTKA